jgi:hypothetical protein
VRVLHSCAFIYYTACTLYFVEEEDANIVFKAIGKKVAKYAEIGRNFGLVPSTIESIRENHPGDNSKALQDVIITWIQQDFNTTRFGLPSWRKVVEVISGFDKLLAKKCRRSSHQNNRYLIWADGL